MTSDRSRPTSPAPSVPRPVASVLLAWLAMVGMDLFLHAGVLAPFYDWDSPFLLEPAEAFIRIPAAYLGLLLIAVALVWLLPRLGLAGGRDGALAGTVLGAVASLVFLLGLWSISTAGPLLLAAWFVGQTLELGVAGFVIGSALGGASLRGVAWRVGALVVVCAISAIVLQSVGYAPAPVINPAG